MSPSLDPPAGHSMKSRTFLPLSTCTITRVSSSHTVTVCWRLYTRSFRGQTQVIQRSTYCIGESHHKITIGSKSCLHQIDSCTYKMRCVAEQHEYSPFSVACWNNSPSSSSSPPAYHIPTPLPSSPWNKKQVNDQLHTLLVDKKKATLSEKTRHPMPNAVISNVCLCFTLIN